MDVPLCLVEQPAPIGGGETRLPDQRGVAPFKEVPDETSPAKVVLQLAGTFDGGLHHLHSPQGTHGLARRQRWRTHGGARTTAQPLRGRSPLREAPKSHNSTQDRASLRKRPSSAIIFALIRRGADDENTPSKVRQENPWQVESTPLQAPFQNPEDVHLLEGRVIRWSQVVDGERAQCELHDNGPVVPIGKHRQDVPSTMPSPGCRPPAG